MTFENISLSEWKVAHKTRLIDHDGELTFADTTDTEWHLMALSRVELVNARLSLRIVARPTEQGNTWLYVNHWGAVDVGYVSRTGEVHEGCCDELSVERDADGRFVIELSYCLAKGTIFLGAAAGPGRQYYAGSGEPQWTIYSVEIEAVPLPDIGMPRADQLVLVDVGAAGGFDEFWAEDLNALHCILFEPNPADAAVLREEMKTFPSVRVVEAALFKNSGIRTLNVTQYDHCSSLLEPDMEQLGRYEVAPCFEVVKKVEVSCIRYDELEDAPAPDVIKIDAQGVEYEVLLGFGKHLDTVLCIELESHFYPIYKGQKLIGDLVKMLAPHGLRLRNLTPQPNFDQDFTEVNAVFAREGELSGNRVAKMAFIDRKLGLKKHPDGGYLTTAFGPGASLMRGSGMLPPPVVLRSG